MNTPEEVVKYRLEILIGAIESTLDSAKLCLKARDYFQCAVRLEMITPVTFDETLMKVFESVSKE